MKLEVPIAPSAGALCWSIGVSALFVIVIVTIIVIINTNTITIATFPTITTTTTTITTTTGNLKPAAPGTRLAVQPVPGQDGSGVRVDDLLDDIGMCVVVCSCSVVVV